MKEIYELFDDPEETKEFNSLNLVDPPETEVLHHYFV